MKKFDIRKFLSAVLAIIMVAAVILGCVGMLAGCSKDNDDGGKTNTNNNNNETPVDPNKYEGLSDAEYFQTLAADELDGLVGTLASTIGNYSELGNPSGDVGVSADLSLYLGDFIMDTLDEYVATALGQEMDMDFLSKISLGLDVDSNDELSQLQLSLGLSDTQIIALSLLMSDDTFWVGAPGLSDTFLEISAGLMGFVPADDQQTEMITELLSIIPEEKEIDKLLTKYVELALKEIDKVERTQTTLELEGLKQDVTQMTVNIYEQDALDAVKAILTAAKDDQNIKKIIDDFAAYYNDMWREQAVDWEDMDLYAGFTEAVESALENLPAEAETTESIGLIFYIDENHDIVGFSLDLSLLVADVRAEVSVDTVAPARISDTATDAPVANAAYAAITWYTVTEGENYKSLLEVRSSEEDYAVFAITGGGTKKDGAINGKYSVAVLGTSYLTIELKDYVSNLEATGGVAVLTPTEEAIEAIFAGPIPYLNVDNIALELGFDIAEGIVNLETKLLGDDAMIVGIALKLADKEVASLQKPTNTVEPNEQSSVLGLLMEMDLDLSTVFTNLRKAGVPEELVTSLEGMVQMAGF